MPFFRFSSKTDSKTSFLPLGSSMAVGSSSTMVLALGSELDNTVIQSFIESVILYPVDSIVELSNGEMAKVVENNKRYPTRPKVVEIQTGKIYNLSEDHSCNNIVVL